ncbi:MAG: pyridoxamine 5'-phosphate oxidase family protein [Spirochaetaceae bacterium]|nr:pyridoxamine 5'-phosphate oxidase family protein [Spirochaetaceae bacterium]
MDKLMMEKAIKIIKDSKDAEYGVINVGFAVLDENGYPSSSAISLADMEGLTELYFTTSTDSNKARRLAKSNKACVSYYNMENNITFVGEAEVLTDQATKDTCWQEWFIEHYTGGKTDPNYCVIKFTVKRANLYFGAEDKAAEFTI